MVDSPASPELMDWSKYYPKFFSPLKSEKKVVVDEDVTMEGTSSSSGEIIPQPRPSSSIASATQATTTSIQQEKKYKVDVADIGCGFGGLLVALAPKLPESLILGMCKKAEESHGTSSRKNNADNRHACRNGNPNLGDGLRD